VRVGVRLRLRRRVRCAPARRAKGPTRTLTLTLTLTLPMNHKRCMGCGRNCFSRTFPLCTTTRLCQQMLSCQQMASYPKNERIVYRVATDRLIHEWWWERANDYAKDKSYGTMACAVVNNERGSVWIELKFIQFKVDE
jgi:hypothetical protein